VPRRLRRGSDAPSSVEPFKPDDDLFIKLRSVVLAKLREVVSKDTRLSLRNPRVMCLAYVSILVHCKLQAGSRRGLSDEQWVETIRREGSASNIKNTIERKWIEARAWEGWCRDGLLPRHSQGYAIRNHQMRWPMLDVAHARELSRQLEEAKRRADKKQIAALEIEIARVGTEPEVYKGIGAERNARGRALELAQPILDMHEVRDEKDFAPKLQAIFLSELPDRHKKTAGYSFVAAIASVILRKRVTVSAVASFLSHPQRVKRRAHRGQVKSGRV